MAELFGKAEIGSLQGLADSSTNSEENKFNSVWFHDPASLPRKNEVANCLDNRNTRPECSDPGFWFSDQLMHQNRSHNSNDDLVDNLSHNALTSYKDAFPPSAIQKFSPQKDAPSLQSNSNRMLYSTVLSGGIKIESSNLTTSASSSSSSFASSFASSSSSLIGMSASKRNPSRYKTELCRPFQENGRCQYGDKCQFAHGVIDLRTVSRHPKYKTDLCKTFHTNGFCPYGPRCHFIHSLDELMIMSSRGNFPTASAYSSILTNGQSYSPPTTPIPAEAYAALHQIPFFARSAPSGFLHRPYLDSLKLTCITNQSVESSGASSASSLSPILQTDSDDQSEFQSRLPVFSSFLK